MIGIRVERTIPTEFLGKIATGEYNIYGGVIREAKTGRIVGHLQFIDPEVMKRFGAPLQPLLHATVALNAMNLAVSVAGFAVVAAKLDAINQTLGQIAEKLDQILGRLDCMGWERERERRANLAANLKNLALGFRIGNAGLVNLAFADLTKSAEFYRAACNNLLEDIKKVYLDPIPFRYCVEMALGASLIQAHALALQGHPRECVLLLRDLKEWHQAQASELEQPLNEPQKHLWLGRLPSDVREECQALVQWQRQVPEGLEYMHNQYQLCVDYRVTPDELGQLTEEDPLALLLPGERDT